MMYPLGIDTVMKSGRCAPTGVSQPDDDAIAQRQRHRVDALRGHAESCPAVRPAIAGAPLPSVVPVIPNCMAAAIAGSLGIGQKFTPFCTAR